MKCYWWPGNSRKNFGDELSPLLIAHFSRVGGQWSTPEMAEIVSTGSVLDVLPQRGYSGIVAGSGKLHERTAPDLTSAKVLGLRGRLTARVVDMRARDRRNLVIGDPGLLASELVYAKRGCYELGVVPHWTDNELYPRELAKARRFKYAEPILIDPCADPLDVISAIGSCKKIIASSLHGIIVADSFYIPRRSEPFAKMTSQYEGGDFKFLDYGSALGQPVEFGKLQLAPMERVSDIQAELFDMFAEIDRIANAV